MAESRCGAASWDSREGDNRAWPRSGPDEGRRVTVDHEERSAPDGSEPSGTAGPDPATGPTPGVATASAPPSGG